MTDALASRLNAAAGDDEGFWDFRGKACRPHAHGLFRYPAMLVPGVTARLLTEVVEVDDASSCFDPFVGAGTALTESQLAGLDFSGCDLNPLAVLLCQVKSGPLDTARFDEAINLAIADATADGSSTCEWRLPNCRKWFLKDVALKLSRLKRAIRSQTDADVRRFLWVALAESVRLSSNSRTSTVKLHLRSKEDLTTRDVDPISLFLLAAKRNVKLLLHLREELATRNLLKKDRYSRQVSVGLRDAADSGDANHDVMITSPPYGDNTTTIAYGQYAYLPLGWIDLTDIDSGSGHVNIEDALDSTHAIDSLCLGGSKRGALQVIDDLSECSETFYDLRQQLSSEPRERLTRVTSFFRDLNSTLDPILSSLCPEAAMIWVTGNRSVGGYRVPLDDILADLLVGRGCREVTRLERRIPSKRMAVRNSVSDTMTRESILVFRTSKG